MRRLGLLPLLGVSALLAHSASAQQSASSAQQFVQQFYAWYAQQGSYTAVLQHRPNAVGGTLRQTLRTAQACERRGEEMCLDADPLWNAQDYCSSYTAGRAVRAGSRYRVPMRGDCGHNMTVEVAQVGRSWQIVRVR